MSSNRTIIFLVGFSLLLFALGIYLSVQAGWWSGQESPQSVDSTGSPQVELPADILSGWEGYAHPELPFAFAHPKDLTPSTFTDGGAEIVLLAGKEPGREVQIVASVFDNSGSLTVERIQKDIPGMAIDEPQNVLIGSARIPALLFWSNDGASVGKTRELWFIQDGYLYQVTASAEMDETLAKMMETWRVE